MEKGVGTVIKIIGLVLAVIGIGVAVWGISVIQFCRFTNNTSCYRFRHR